MAWLPELSQSTGRETPVQTDVPAILWPVLYLPANTTFTISALLERFLRDRRKYWAYNLERNNPGSSAALTVKDTRQRLLSFHRYTWIPGLVFKAPLILPQILSSITLQLPRSQITPKSVLVLHRDACSLDLQPALLAALCGADLCWLQQHLTAEPTFSTTRGMVLEDGDDDPDVSWVPDHTELRC